jgi:hypothetical protein
VGAFPVTNESVTRSKAMSGAPCAANHAFTAVIDAALGNVEGVGVVDEVVEAGAAVDDDTEGRLLLPEHAASDAIKHVTQTPRATDEARFPLP